MTKKKYSIFAQVDETMKELVSDYAKKEFCGNESLALRKIIEKFFSKINKEE